MELAEAIYGRRSVRVFRPKAVAKPVLERLIDAAVHAPSAVNAQSWDFTVIQKPSLLDRISDGSKAHLIRSVNDASFPQHLQDELRNPDFHVFYHAPVLIVISAKYDDWSVENASLAAENLMLMAHGLGLGSCWIGLAQRWLETDEGRRAVTIPKEFLPVAPIIVGYAAQPVNAVQRNPPRTRWID